MSVCVGGGGLTAFFLNNFAVSSVFAVAITNVIVGVIIRPF